MARQARKSSYAENRLPSRALVLGVLVLAAVYFLLPLWWLLVAATKSQGDVSSTFGFWFSRVQLAHNLDRLFSYDGGIFTRWLVNSLQYAAVGGLVATALACLAGYALAVFQFRGRKFLYSLAFGAVLVPNTALALPLFLLFSKMHVVDTAWAVILPSTVFPFGVYLAFIFCATAIPPELLDAARADGASEFRIFFSIALPLITPGAVTIFLFAFVSIWNNFFLPLVMLQSEKLYPSTLGLYSLSTQTTLLPGAQLLVTIGSVVSVLPLMAMFLLLQRYWRAGLAMGAVR